MPPLSLPGSRTAPSRLDTVAVGEFAVECVSGAGRNTACRVPGAGGVGG